MKYCYTPSLLFNPPPQLWGYPLDSHQGQWYRDVAIPALGVRAKPLILPHLVHPNSTS